MKITYIIAVLMIFAWPLYYLYQRQLGAISFLLLAIFFLFLTVKEVKAVKRQSGKYEIPDKKEKWSRKSR